MARKTDNTSVAAKLALRRYFLDMYHKQEPADVLDCCQGRGVLWRRLRKEYDLAGYWGLDIKPGRGRLRVDSVRVLAQPGWTQNVIDIDTYGSPWKHWLAMLPNVTRPLTAFLTVGVGGPGRLRLGKEELIAMGITIERVLAMSGAITHPMAEMARRYSLTRAYDYGLAIVEAKEAYEHDDFWATRYIGVRLEPTT